MFKKKCKTEVQTENSSLVEKSNKKPGFFNNMSNFLGPGKSYALTDEDKAARKERLTSVLAGLGL